VTLKVVVVGHVVPNETPYGEQWYLSAHTAWMGLADFGYRPLLQALAGTWLEIEFVRALGGNVGQGVYMDSIYAIEPDLLTIGDNVSLNKFCTLSPHQYTPAGAEFAPIEIGARCTIGSNATLHGRDVVDDDTFVDAMSMPLIGTHLTSGQWTGYPARKTTAEVVLPPSLPNPTWYTMLRHPVSTVFACAWFVFLFLDRYVGIGRWLSAQTRPALSTGTLPRSLEGTFTFVDSSTSICFDRAVFHGLIRGLRLPRATYAMCKSEWKMNPWWDWATYYWSFNANFTMAQGRVHLGPWLIPQAVFSAKLERKDDEWIWTHSWFENNPVVVARLRRTHS